MSGTSAAKPHRRNGVEIGSMPTNRYVGTKGSLSEIRSPVNEPQMSKNHRPRWGRVRENDRTNDDEKRGVTAGTIRIAEAWNE